MYVIFEMGNRLHLGYQAVEDQELRVVATFTVVRQGETEAFEEQRKFAIEMRDILNG